MPPRKQKSAKKTKRPPNARPIVTYDFKHPRRVSKDQTRTLENLHSNFSRMMAASFSNIQRSVVDCDIAFVDQTTYAEFIMSLSNPSCSYTFKMEPMGGSVILDFSFPVTCSFINRAFGGEGGSVPAENSPLTRIERSVMARAVLRALADLEATWRPLVKAQVSDVELETNPEFMQIAAPGDTVMLIAFEVNSRHSRGLVNLCYPYFTLEPIMSYLNVQTWASRGGGRRQPVERRQRRLDQLKGIQSEVAAIWGRGRVRAEDIARLREGDTLVLGTKVTDPGVLFVEDQPIFLTRPGVSDGGQYAVELLRSIPQEETRHYI